MLSAKVKSVLSGDTIILTPAAGNSTTERLLSLAFVSAPRLSKEEAYGFQSREYLRTLLVGKVVKFSSLYTIGGREYGDVASPIFDSLIKKSLADGNVKLREGDERDVEGYDFAELQKLQKSAESAKKGVWATSAAIDVNVPALSLAVDPAKPIHSIVEKVTAADKIHMRLILSPTEHYVGSVLLAGVRGPGADEPAMAEKAKAFVDVRLLQRSVNVYIVGKSNLGVPIARIVHPQGGDIAQVLLGAGFATVADWQSSFLGAKLMKELRLREKAAQDAKAGIWSVAGSTPPASPSVQGYDAVVARVISADTLVLRKRDDTEVTAQLASIRGPRRDNGEAAVAVAREYVRSKFIGKKVFVYKLSTRVQEGYEPRDLVTVTFHNNNIALRIVQDGMATVIHHRKDDFADRSPIWDDLLEAEASATEKGLGIHSKKPLVAPSLVNASESAQKANAFFAQLDRQSKINAVVDHVINGGRLRLLVPSQNISLTLVFSGVRFPKHLKGEDDDLSSQALKYTSKRLLQRDVQFDVHGMDRTGAFTGQIYLPGGNVPFALALVKEGLAEVHDFSAQQTGLYDALTAAEAEAKAHKKGLWQNYQPGDEDEEEPSATAQRVDAALSPRSENSQLSAAPMPHYIDVTGTYVSPLDGTIYYIPSSRDSQYKKMFAELQAKGKTAPTVTSTKKKSELCIAESKGVFYRARVLSFDKVTRKYSLQLIDSGEVVTATQLKSLPDEIGAKAYPAFARAAILTYVRIPPSQPTDYLSEYVDYLESQIKGKQIVLNVDSPDSAPEENVTIYLEGSKGVDDHLNGRLIEDGYASLKKRLAAWERRPKVEKDLRALETKCREERYGIWQYGDPFDEE